MLEKIKKWTGLEKRNPYINEYFERSNLRASIYMAIINRYSTIDICSRYKN